MNCKRRTNSFLHRGLPIRTYNLVGGFLGRLGLPLGRLTEQSLFSAARRRTGLSDFGDESFRTPLQILLRAYEDEAELNPFGRLLVRWSTLNLVSNRLRVREELHKHPEILQVPVRRPLFIAGLPRTGTTLLYNLLAQDEGSRPLLMWEAISPAPRAEEAGRVPDPRIRRAVRVAGVLRRLAPTLSTVHPITPEGPEECSRLLMNTFVTVYAVMENHVPSYRDWFLGLPEETIEAAYRDYGTQLQLLQWQRPPRGYWLLKSPAHLFGLKALMRVFPDAGVIQIHRDPCKVVPSLCSLFAVYRGMASDRVSGPEIGSEVLALCAEGLRRGQAARDAASPGRLLDLKYEELVRDPVGTVRRVYEHFGLSSDDGAARRVERWYHENPKNKHGKHRYDLEQFGLDRETVQEALGDYCRQYGIEPEDPKETTPSRRSSRPARRRTAVGQASTRD